MGFRKKNSKSNEATAGAPLAEGNAPQHLDAPAPAKKKSKKKGAGMASLFTETVPEQILDELSSNKPFIVDRGGSRQYVAVMFTADDIGGLDKKAMKNEDKGQLVQQLDSGAIAAYFTAETIENEEIIFIPNSTSMSNVEEFGIVRNIPWKFVYINTEAEIERTDIETNYDEVLAVLEGSKSIYELIGSFVSPESDAPADNSDEGADVDEEMPDMSGISDVIEEEDEETPVYDDESEDIPFDEPEVAPVYDEPEGEPSYDDAPVDEGSYEDYDENPEAYDSGETNDAPAEYNEIDVERAITRRFYSDELGLEVATEPFDSHFVHGNDYLPFDESRPSGWLNDYLNEMSRNANIEMQRIHNANLHKMKVHYLDVMAKHCEDIQKELDTQDPATYYGQMADAMRNEQNKEREKLDEAVAVRKNELNKEWEEKLREVAEQGAQDARNRYRERYGRQHDDDLLHIGPMLRDELEANYTVQIRNLNEERKKEALKRLDYAINETLTEVSGIYEGLLNEEVQRYRELEKEIKDYLDDNRKNDVAHDQALAEELAQTQKADMVIAEYTERLQSMKEEFESKKASLNADLERMQRENELALQKKEDEWQEKYARSENTVAEQRGEINGLLDKYAGLDAAKNQEFSARINELKNEKDALEDKCQHIVNTHKTANHTVIFITIIAVIAALAIGFIGGYFVYSNTSKKAREEAIVQEYNDRLSEIERKYEEQQNGSNNTSDKQTTTETTTTSGTTNTTEATTEATTTTSSEDGN